MKIGDEVYVHGYVDEIRKGTYVDIVIIRNKGGYFGTDASEVILADRKTEPRADCATCRHSDTWEAECRACDNYSNYEPRKENPQADCA